MRSTRGREMDERTPPPAPPPHPELSPGPGSVVGQRKTIGREKGKPPEAGMWETSTESEARNLRKKDKVRGENSARGGEF